MGNDWEEIVSPETDVIEKCSQLIINLCKIEKFGWFPPKENNLEKVIVSIENVNESLNNLLLYINEVIDEEEGED